MSDDLILNAVDTRIIFLLLLTWCCVSTIVLLCLPLHNLSFWQIYNLVILMRKKPKSLAKITYGWPELYRSPNFATIVHTKFTFGLPKGVPLPDSVFIQTTVDSSQINMTLQYWLIRIADCQSFILPSHSLQILQLVGDNETHSTAQKVDEWLKSTDCHFVFAHP